MNYTFWEPWPWWWPLLTVADSSSRELWRCSFVVLTPCPCIISPSFAFGSDMMSLCRVSSSWRRERKRRIEKRRDSMGTKGIKCPRYLCRVLGKRSVDGGSLDYYFLLTIYEFQVMTDENQCWLHLTSVYCANLYIFLLLPHIHRYE